MVSHELGNDGRAKGAPQVAARAKRGAVPSVGIVLLLSGAVLWLFGAKYTVDGWVIGVNWVSAWLGLSGRIPAVAGLGLLAALPIGMLYSRVETTHAPIQWAGGLPRYAPPSLWIAWLIIVGTDVATTYTGVRAPTAGAMQIARDVAASGAASAVWALVLTFAPEWLMLSGKRLMGW